MNCPKCGKEMEEGYLYSCRRDLPIRYRPKGVGMPWRFWPQKKLKEAGCINIESDYQNLVLNVSFRGHRAKAYICKDCRTGIFEYDEEPEKPSIWDI